MVFETEAEARAVADRFEVGEPPDPEAPEGVESSGPSKFREVIATV